MEGVAGRAAVRLQAEGRRTAQFYKQDEGAGRRKLHLKR